MVHRLRTSLDVRLTTAPNSTRFSLLEHPAWLKVAEGALERPDDQRSLGAFRELLRKRPDRMRVLELAITDRTLETVVDDKPIVHRGFTVRLPSSPDGMLRTLRELSPEEYQDLAIQQLHEEAEDSDLERAADEACRTLFGAARQRTAELPRRHRTGRSKSLETEGVFSTRGEREGIQRFYDHPITEFGAEEEVAASFNNDSVSYLYGMEVSVKHVQLPSGALVYRATASALWVHDTGRRFRDSSDVLNRTF